MPKVRRGDVRLHPRQGLEMPQGAVRREGGQVSPVPHSFPNGVNKTEVQAAIDNINEQLSAAKNALIKKHGSWQAAKVHKEDLKEYNRLIRERGEWRKWLQ